MPYTNFTGAYKNTTRIIKEQQFEKDWQLLINKVKLFMSDSELLDTSATALDEIRQNLDSSKPKRGAIKTFIQGSGVGELIIAACKDEKNTGNLEEKAAVIKFLKHFYQANKSGAQCLWIYSPPKAYSKWIYDEIKLPEKSCVKKLEKETEVYSVSERKIMWEALLLARDWSQQAVVKLNAPDTDTEKTVKEWFFEEGNPNDNEPMLKFVIKILATGFQKVTAATISPQLVFSDEPIDRNAGGWKDYAYVKSADSMHAIYLQNAFLKAGNSGKTWLCALTIIHELTHRVLKTEDIRYDYDGLKPGKSIKDTKSWNNADSWSYFALDLVGKLSEADKLRVLK